MKEYKVFIPALAVEGQPSLGPVEVQVLADRPERSAAGSLAFYIGNREHPVAEFAYGCWMYYKLQDEK